MDDDRRYVFEKPVLKTPLTVPDIKKFVLYHWIQAKGHRRMSLETFSSPRSSEAIRTVRRAAIALCRDYIITDSGKAPSVYYLTKQFGGIDRSRVINSLRAFDEEYKKNFNGDLAQLYNICVIDIEQACIEAGQEYLIWPFIPKTGSPSSSHAENAAGNVSRFPEARR